jgi:hypothetical protein
VDKLIDFHPLRTTALARSIRAAQQCVFAPVSTSLVISQVLFLAAASVMVDMTVEGFYELDLLLIVREATMAEQIAHASLAHL